ncbi:hypothetical protein Zm00014a_016101 [Zea mays]|uniref:Uncharacterized protein n=1 Tax=Zea mays TaxID=4577 RepID=A0A3L6FVP7_MAIZE|nr:hypothetical protein Zm00014a_016101 [Zea mays]
MSMGGSIELATGGRDVPQECRSRVCPYGPRCSDTEKKTVLSNTPSGRNKCGMCMCVTSTIHPKKTSATIQTRESMPETNFSNIDRSEMDLDVGAYGQAMVDQGEMLLRVDVTPSWDA